MIPLVIALALPPQEAQKPYTGPHTLAKTWGDQFPGLREKPKPLSPAKASSRPPAAPAAKTPSTPKAAPTTAIAAPSSAPSKVPAQPASTASSQTTFFNGGNKTGDGRIDVMHFRDGKMAVTMGKDWNCSSVSDTVQRKVVIVCDGKSAK